MDSQAGLHHWADILTVVLYFAFVLAVGLWSIWRKNRGNVDGYFLAGRTMPWFAVGASIFGSNIGSEHFIGLAGAGAASGFVLVLYEFVPALLVLVLSWLILPVFISAGVYTLPEYMEKRFGGRRIRLYLSVMTLVMHIVTRLSATIFSGAIYIQLALNWNMYPSIIGLLIITGLFTMLGGLRAVMYTDTAQTFIMVIGALVVMGLSLNKIGGYENLYSAYQTAIPSVRDKNSTCGLPRDDAFHLLRGLDSDYPWPSTIIQCWVASAYYWICDQIMVQRCLAAKNISHAKGGSLLAGYLKILPLFIMIIPGMISRILYPDEVACVDPEICSQVCDNPAGCSNIAYPKLVLELLPEGARGLIMAVMLSAILTSLTSIFNSSSTVFTMDLWRRIRPNAHQRELLLVGRGYIVVLCILTVLWIPVVKAAQGGQLFTYVVVVEGFIGAPLPILLCLAVFWKKTTEKAAFYGIVITHILGIIRLVVEVIYPKPLCGDSDNRPLMLSKVHSFYYSEMLMVIQLVLVVSISLCTKGSRSSDSQLNGTTWGTRLKVDDDKLQRADEEMKLGEDTELEVTANHDNGDQNKDDTESKDVDAGTMEAEENGEIHRSSWKFVHLCNIFCGVPEKDTSEGIDIKITNRIKFLTESSPFSKSLTSALAILLIGTMSFLVGFFK